MLTYPICHFSGGADPWFSNDNADIVYFFGESAVELFRFGEPAGGNQTGKIASTVLAPVTTPLYQQVLTGGVDDPLGAGFDNATLDSFDAANATVFDDTTNSWCWFYVWRFPATPLGNNRMMIGKLDATPLGWWVFATINATNIYFQIFGAGGSKSLALFGYVPNTNVHYLVVGRRAGNDFILYGDIVNTSTPEGAVGSVTSTGIFSFGSVRTSAAAGHTGGIGIRWIGAAADAVLTNRATIFPAWAAAAGI